MLGVFAEFERAVIQEGVRRCHPGEGRDEIGSTGKSAPKLSMRSAALSES
jgi:hypothetical protein